MVAEGGVAAAGVVEGFDEVEDGESRLGLGAKRGPVNELALEGGEEALAERVVEAVTGRMDDMILSASLGGVCFLLEGFIVGSNLALDGLGVWGMILAILVGIASQRGEADPHSLVSPTTTSDSPASR
jgi:hypothetical protein